MLSRINLALVDDHVLFRKTLKNYLLEQGRFSIPISTSSPVELLDQLGAYPVDIVLCDILKFDIDEIEVLGQIRSLSGNIKVIVVSESTDISLVSDLLDAGVSGFVSKRDEPEELLQAIQSVAQGSIFRNRYFTEALYWNKQLDFDPLTVRGTVRLNDREKRILQLIWDEKNGKEIANVLYLSVRSIEKIRQDLKVKLDVKSTIGLMKYAMRERIISHPRSFSSSE